MGRTATTRLGPLAAGMAWDLPVEIVDKRPEWTVSVVPLYIAEPADQIIARSRRTARRRPTAG